MRKIQRMRVVCFGGGTGLSSLLSGLKKMQWLDITAIVTMFDSGGSSGQLRGEFGILPPSDIMRCLVALSKHEKVAEDILTKRIRNENMPGHTAGNVMLLGLENVYKDYLDAVDAFAQALSVRGKVIPVSIEKASLQADYKDGTHAQHEAEVDVGMVRGKLVQRLYLTPPVHATWQAIEAIQKAHVLVVGPGSLYTSVLPPFLPEGICDAIKGSSAPVVFIANLLTEGRGLLDVGIVKSVEIAERFVGRPFDTVICNDRTEHSKETLRRYIKENKFPILPSVEDAQRIGERLVAARLWTDPDKARHDADRLAQLIFAQAHMLLLQKGLEDGNNRKTGSGQDPRARQTEGGGGDVPTRHG